MLLRLEEKGEVVRPNTSSYSAQCNFLATEVDQNVSFFEVISTI